MRRPLLLLLAVTGFVTGIGCATGGYEILSGQRATTPSVGAGVKLYGVETQENPPPGCRVLGTIRAWSFGEKTFPYDQLRGAASELGGDAVVDIHPDPTATDPKRPTHVGTVQRCGA